MGTVSDQILCELLECGEADLEKFEGCAYDMSDVVEVVKEDSGSPTYHDFLRGIVKIGLQGIVDSVNDRIRDLKELGDLLNEEEREELEQISGLNPIRDTDAYYNFRDTHIRFVRNADLYHRYFQSDLDCFEEETGFVIEG